MKGETGAATILESLDTLAGAVERCLLFPGCLPQMVFRKVKKTHKTCFLDFFRAFLTGGCCARRRRGGWCGAFGCGRHCRWSPSSTPAATRPGPRALGAWVMEKPCQRDGFPKELPARGRNHQRDPAFQSDSSACALHV